MDIKSLITSVTVLTQISFGTYSDIARTQPQVNFSPGQAVYLEVSDLPGEIYLLDEDKQRLSKIENKQFTAPSSRGVYYVDARLSDGEGKSFSGQRNINVSGETVTNDPAPTVIPESIVTSTPYIYYEKTEVEPILPPSTPNWKRVIISVFRLLGLDFML